LRKNAQSVSIYPDKATCIQGLVSEQNLSLAVATQQCESQFGPSTGTVSGKTRKAVLDRIMKQYPNLSRESAELIVTEAIRSSQRKVTVDKSRKSISPLQANSRHFYAASVAEEIPAYLSIDLVRSGQVEPSDTTTASKQGAKDWYIIEQHKEGKKIAGEQKLKSAKTLEDTESWLVTSPTLTERNFFQYKKQTETKTKKSGKILNANTDSDKPAFLVIEEFNAKGSAN
jgi:hypothetical protein